MKFFRSFIAILAATVVLSACKKEHSAEEGEKPVTIENEWQFSISDTISRGPMDSAFVQSVGSVSTLSMVGSTGDEKQGEIFLQVVGETITTGTYSNPLVFFQYAEGGNVVYQSSPVQTGGFTINITALDSTTAEGTFSGTVLDGDGNELTIAEGKFKTIIKGWENTPDPVVNGQLTVWANQICVDGSAIEIRIDNQTAQLTDALATEPECGASGTAVFSLTGGTYTLEAICNTDTLRYEVQIAEGCTVLQVDFLNPPELNDYLPLTIGSSWDYRDIDEAAITQTITAEGQEEIDQRMYTKFVSTTGEIFHYRKEQNVYFQNVKLDFEGAAPDAPTIEMVILYDNLDEGQSWETPGENITISGVPVKVKLISTITRKGFQQSYNGVPYSDLIEVNTEMFFSADGGNSYQSSNSAYNTVFAKGKGIVYYYDIERDTEWVASNITINP
jgi:hypothetical protein